MENEEYINNSEHLSFKMYREWLYIDGIVYKVICDNYDGSNILSFPAGSKLKFYRVLDIRLNKNGIIDVKYYVDRITIGVVRKAINGFKSQYNV